MPTLSRPILCLAALAASSPALAHGDDAIDLHVGYEYKSCYIDLHEELDAGEFQAFAREFADVGAFLPMAGAQALGAGHVAFGLNYKQTFVDDSTPQWNHSFSHPGDEHFLGSPALPTLQGRVGITRRVDAELMVSGDPSSNWAIAGVAARHEILREGEKMPISVTGRATFTHLFGAEDVDHEGGSVEILASRAFGPVTAFAGGGLSGSVAMERTAELDLDSAFAIGGRGLVGAELAIGHFRVAAQGHLASVPSAAVMVGGAF